MNKNILIGLLVAILVIGGGYYLLRNSTPPATTTDTTTPTTSNTTTPSNTNSNTPPLTLSTPTVETSSSYSASVSTAAVNGRVTPNGVPTVYWYEYGTTNALGSRTAQQSIGSGFSAINAPGYITGLRANTVYYYRLMASNSLGAAYGATDSLKTNNAPAPTPAVPTVRTESATNVSRTDATINGQVNPRGFTANYWFEYGKTTGFGNITSIQSISDSSALNSSTAVNESISGLEPLTRYYFRLDAQNQFGTVTGTTLSFTTAGPVSPGAPTVSTTSATNITNSTATLNGRINPNGVDTTYWFEYSNDSLLGSIIGSGTATQTLNAGTSTISVHADIDSLNNNTKYYYHLVGRNSYGTVSGSIMSFTTKN